MIFICGCRSAQFRKELRRQGVGVSWKFIRKEATGWDRSLRCEEQNGDNKALDVTKKPSQAAGKSQAKTPRPINPSPKREKAEAFFSGKCTIHMLKDCKVAPGVECRNCNKAGHLAKICTSHIFNPLSTPCST